METMTMDAIRVSRDSVWKAVESAGFDADLRDLVLWHHRYCQTRRLGVKQRALLADLDENVCRRVWNGRGDKADAAEFRRRVSALRDQCGKDNTGLYADTSYARLIIRGAQRVQEASAQRRGRFLFIEGDAGCGKTVTLQALAQMDLTGRVFYYRTRTLGGPKAMATWIGEMVGIDPTLSYTRLLSKLFNAFRPGDMLIIDEAHKAVDEDSARQSKIEAVRDLVDECCIASVFASTEHQFDSKLNKTGYNKAQFNRRAPRKLYLPKRSEDYEADLEVLFKFLCPTVNLNAGLRANFELLHEHPHGGWGMVGLAIEDAMQTAEEEDRVVTVSDLATTLKQFRDSLEKGGRRV